MSFASRYLRMLVQITVLYSKRPFIGNDAFFVHVTTCYAAASCLVQNTSGVTKELFVRRLTLSAAVVITGTRWFDSKQLSTQSTQFVRRSGEERLFS